MAMILSIKLYIFTLKTCINGETYFELYCGLINKNIKKNTKSLLRLKALYI